MGVLARFEKRLGGLVEGAFARAFKSGVEPVELAGALCREADDKRTIGPQRTLIPNAYGVELGTSDYERLAPYALTLADELAAMVAEHAQEQGYSTVDAISVRLLPAQDVVTGTYRILSGVNRGAAVAASAPAVGDPPRGAGSALLPGPSHGAGPAVVADPDPWEPAPLPGPTPTPLPDDPGPLPLPPPLPRVEPRPVLRAPGTADPALAAGAAADAWPHVDGLAGAAADGAASWSAARPTAAPVPDDRSAAEPGATTDPPSAAADRAGSAVPGAGPAAASLAGGALSAVPGGALRLELASGEAVHLIAPVMVLGRGSEADIQLPDDPGISRRHVRLDVVAATATVTDLGSTNGTLVNDRSVQRATLRPGDRITIGSTTLTLRSG